MTLITFIKDPKVKELFRKHITFNPTYVGRPKIYSQTKNYALVGTAFDYIIRFYLKKNNKEILENFWISEIAVDMLKQSQPFSDGLLTEIEKSYSKGTLNQEFSKLYETYYLDKHTNRQHNIAKKIVETSKIELKKYINNKKNSIFSCALKLAKLDMIARGNVKLQLASLSNFSNTYYQYDGDFEDYLNIDEKDVDDLKKMHSLLEKSNIDLDKETILNPTFDEGSKLVAGADADLIIGNTLVDIKTTMSSTIGEYEYHQLIGYYILSKLGSINKKSTKLENFAIYLSRHGKLIKMKIPDISFKFIKKFEELAKEKFASRKKKIKEKKPSQ